MAGIDPFFSVAVHPDQTDADAHEMSEIFQAARLSFRESSLFPKSPPWFIRPTVLERERKRILEIPSNSRANTLARRLELSALAFTVAGTLSHSSEIDSEDRLYLLGASRELFESSVFVFYGLDPPSGTDRVARVVDAVRDARKIFTQGGYLSKAAGTSGAVFSELSGFLKDLGPRLPRRVKDSPIEQERTGRGMPAEVSRKIFGKTIATKAELEPEPDSEHSWAELVEAIYEGMRGDRTGRAKVARRLGFASWELLELAQQKRANDEGRYLLKGRERNQWITRERAAEILAQVLKPGEELAYPRAQLQAVLMMSPSDFGAYQKAMRGKYANPRAPRAARSAASSALERRRARALSTTRPGGTTVGVARARDISRGRNLSDRTLARMRSFFARHDTPAEQAARQRDPNGRASISWDLWGGDAAREWLQKLDS